MKRLLCVNLVPVQEFERAGRKRAHRRIEIAAIATTALILLALTWREWDTELELRTRLGREVAAGNSPGTAADLLQERLGAWQQELSMLESIEGPAVSHNAVLRSVAEALPDAVWLKRFEMTRNTLILEGRAKDHALIAEFLRELDSRPPFMENQLTGVHQPKEVLAETSTRFFTRSRIVSIDERAKHQPETTE